MEIMNYSKVSNTLKPRLGMKRKHIYVLLRNKIIGVDSVITMCMQIHKDCDCEFTFMLFEHEAFKVIKKDNIVLSDAINKIGSLVSLSSKRHRCKVFSKIHAVFFIIKMIVKINYKNSLIMHSGGLHVKPLNFITKFIPLKRIIFHERSSYGRCSYDAPETFFNCRQSQDEFESDEDDFTYFEKKYEKAVKDDDDKDIEKYEKKLEDLDDDLKDLENDVEDMIDDLEDEDDIDESLLDDLSELEDDIMGLRDDIDDLLNGEDNSSQYNTLLDNYIPPQSSGSSVQIQPLDFTGFNQDGVQESGFSNLRMTLLFVAGIVILLSVILFLLALLLK